MDGVIDTYKQTKQKENRMQRSKTEENARKIFSLIFFFGHLLFQDTFTKSQFRYTLTNMRILGQPHTHARKTNDVDKQFCVLWKLNDDFADR